MVTIMILSFIHIMAATFEIDKIVYEPINNSEVTVIGTNDDKKSGIFIIPSEISYDNKSYFVRKIADVAFVGCKFSAVQLPSTLREIGYGAFSQCSNLEQIIIPESVEKIGYSCFNQCGKLNQIKLPSQLKYIEKETFWYCESLQEIDLPNSIIAIEDGAFVGTSIKRIVIPPSVYRLGSSGCMNNPLPRELNYLFILSNKIDIYNYVGYEKTVIVSFAEKNPFVTPQLSDATLYALSSVIQTNAYSNHRLKVKEIESFIDIESDKVYNGQPIKMSLNWPQIFSEAQIAGNIELPTLVDAGSYEGQCRLSISYKDYFSYDTSLSYTASIKKANLNIVVTNEEKVYGRQNPSFNFTVDGFIGSDNINNALDNISLHTIANQTSEVGVYDILFSANSENYRLNITQGKLTITKAPLILSVSDTEKTYGEHNPQFHITYEGLQLNDTETSVFSQLPTVTTDATVKSDVGVYPLTANGGVARNYEIIEYIPGDLTITKAPLTLSANNTERFYHTDNPVFDYTLTGLVNDDDKSCLTKKPEFACTATLTSECGEYDIIPSNAEAKNYEISYNNGKMTIAKSPLSISVVDVSREYGDPNPKFEFIYSGFKDGEDASSLSVLPKATCSARPNSPVGYYDIEVSGAESQNYDITYTPGILTVTAAPLTIRAKDVNRVFGTAPPIRNFIFWIQERR